MNFEEAKELLSTSVRWELRDHAFGDTEFGWQIGGEEIGNGYAGGGRCTVTVGGTSFADDAARELRNCGVLGEVHRNDETGPDTYAEGQVMDGLSQADVLAELTADGVFEEGNRGFY
jgi:hypothetical protein